MNLNVDPLTKRDLDRQRRLLLVAFACIYKHSEAWAAVEPQSKHTFEEDEVSVCDTIRQLRRITMTP